MLHKCIFDHLEGFSQFIKTFHAVNRCINAFVHLDSIESHPMLAGIFARERFLSMEIDAQDGEVGATTIPLDAVKHLKNYTSTIPSNRTTTLPAIVLLCGVKQCGKSTAILECARHAAASKQPGPYCISEFKGFDWRSDECKRNVVMHFPYPHANEEQLSIQCFNKSFLRLPIIEPADDRVLFSRHIKNANRVPTFATLVLDNFDTHMQKSKVGSICMLLAMSARVHVHKSSQSLVHMLQVDCSFQFLEELYKDAEDSGIFNIIVVLSEPHNVSVFKDRFKSRFAHVVMEWTKSEATSMLLNEHVSKEPVIETSSRLDRAVRELTGISGSVHMARSIMRGTYVEGDEHNVIREHTASKKMQELRKAIEGAESLQSFINRKLEYSRK